MTAATVAPALNERQQQVVENTRDSLLLLAGAGTGKTNTLALRIAHLVASGTAKPEELLCLTFTNRACKELLERVERVVGDAAKEVTIRTIHSFCVWLLRHTPQSLTDVGRDFTVCDQPDCLEVLREVVFEVTGRTIDDRPAGILQGFAALVKDCRLARPEFGCAEAAAHLFVNERARLEQLCTDGKYRFDPKFYAFLSKYGASIVRLYDLKLTSNNMLDFSDLLLRADALLREPETAALWRDRFRYVHVDEVQDVSLAEYRLIARLCGGATVLFCGDFNQTIYQWRGSDPGSLVSRFQKDFSPVVVEFDKNYRSSGQLLAVAQNFLHAAFQKGAHGGPGPSAPACGDAVVRSFDTPSEEVRWIYEQIAALEIKDYSRVAIIARTNKACTDVCGLLKENRLSSDRPIRFMLADEFRLFKRAEIKDLLACLSLVANPRDGEALKRVLTRLVRGVGPSTVNAVVSRYRDGLGVALPDFIDRRTRGGDYFEPLLSALETGKVVVFDVESTGTDVYSDDIVQIAAVRLDAQGNVAARFERFLRPTRPVGESERVHGFSDVFLAERGEEPRAALEAFIEFADGCVVVGHNVGFDLTITARNLSRAGSARTFEPLWYDTLDLSRRFLKTLENHKLSTVSTELGAKNEPTHDAMDDILATADVLNALNARYLRPRTEERRACYAKYLPRFEEAARLIDRLREQARGCDAPALIRLLSDAFGLRETYAEAPEQLANLLLFEDFAQETADPEKPLEQQLSDLLELTALSASELDRLSRTANKVAVITAHQAKGCEFDYVFLPVLQDGVFPTFQAVRSGDFNEEKRVFYVSITRAKRKLFLTWSRFTATQYPAKPSRFLALLD